MQRSLLGILAVTTVLLAGTGAAFAEPQEWQWGFQAAVTPVMDDIHSFYDYVLLPMMVIISVFVAGLLGYIVFRFRRSANPTPARTTHNTLLEVIWTGLPILILIGIAVPSLRLLYFEATVPEAAITVKATGHQWYWSYEYPDHGGIAFDAMLDDAAEPRLLVTDNEVVLPAGQVVRVQVTSADVIHAWAMPPAGIKIDAVPGRLNEIWMEINEPGIYYGQCSELCGVLHGFMPITLRVVSPEEFDAWVGEQQAAMGITPTVDVAAATQN